MIPKHPDRNDEERTSRVGARPAREAENHRTQGMLLQGWLDELSGFSSVPGWPAAG